jgi:hypothetical protein
VFQATLSEQAQLALAFVKQTKDINREARRRLY